MSTHERMTPERLDEARAALDEDHSQWGGEYGLDLLREVQRLKRFESIVSWRYGDTTDGQTREDMTERAARAFYEHPTPGIAENLRTNWDRLVEASPDVADNYRRHIAAALDAALGTQEEA